MNTFGCFKEGDIIEFEKPIRTGTRKVSRKRGYDTFPVYTLTTIRAVVHIGPFEDNLYCAYYTTDQKEAYDSYFYGTGKKTDVPKKVINPLDSIMKSGLNYIIVGRVEND